MIRLPVKISIFPLVFGVAALLFAVAADATADATEAHEGDTAVSALVTQGDVAAANVVPLLPSQDDGAAVYSQRCASCHQPGGVGVPGSFPPLAANPNAADPGYVEDVIVNGLEGPIEVDGVAYDTVMPAVDLSEGERAAVVEYVVGLAATAPTTDDAAEPAAAEPVVGDADRGRNLFTGSTSFENGGGACVSCHEAGDVGHWGGAALGPDLDDTFDNLGGEAGLSAWLTSPASPTMQPIFNDEPMTEAEIADVVAFLESAPERERPQSYGDALLLGGVAGLVVLMGGMALARQTMNPSYTQRLRSKQ
jgi:mono/diheme cytochrome c family protein